MSRRKKLSYKARRTLSVLIALLIVGGVIYLHPDSYETIQTVVDNPKSGTIEPLGVSATNNGVKAADILERLPVKGRAPKTGYSRDQFYDTWPSISGCSLRQLIIKREMGDTAVVSNDDNCSVLSGEYDEPYTGSHMIFYQKSDFTLGVQIDHVVALSDAWQKGAQSISTEERYNLATDPLNLIAVDSKSNQNKADGDAATWLPPNKSFRCAYVARQVSVKYKYHLWVTKAEKEAIANILKRCPNEPAVGISDLNNI
ncbi:HNH endonuclease [Candidatus Saccharibacteria bacterium]|nr:HNH endonuclease [Candidatus Saccharibacteria bacterium]